MFFDIATRPTTAAQARQIGAHFDWRLTPPESAQPLTSTLYTTAPPTVDVQLMQVYSLVLEPTLHTAVILSWFTEGRAGADDVLPHSAARRGGWVGSEFMPPTQAGTRDADNWGARLWLGWSGMQTAMRLDQMRFWAEEAIAWMVRDQIAEKVEVEALWVNDQLALRPRIYKPGDLLPAYDVLWGTTLTRGEQA